MRSLYLKSISILFQILDYMKFFCVIKQSKFYFCSRLRYKIIEFKCLYMFLKRFLMIV